MAVVLLLLALVASAKAATVGGTGAHADDGMGFISSSRSNNRYVRGGRVRYEFINIDLGLESPLSSSPRVNKDVDVAVSGSRRLLRQVRLPLAATFETHPIPAPVVTTAMTQVPAAGPRSRKYFGYWRSFTSSTRQSAATFDLDTNKTHLVTTRYDHFCSGPVVLTDGSTALFGGFDQRWNRNQRDGRKAISVYNDNSQVLTFMRLLILSRWYPTPCITADNKVLIVGGTAKADMGPPYSNAELWDPARPTKGTVRVPIPPSFQYHAGFNWYPFIVLLPRGEILWWGDRGGSITDHFWEEIYTFPDLPDSFPYRTMYPYTASIVLNAMKPDPHTGEYNEFSMTIFGGAVDKAGSSSPAANVSARLDMYYCDESICDRGWVIEDMAGQRRVLSTTTVLPNGKVLVHGGGQAGHAGWKKGENGYQAILPAFQDLLYDPDAPLGSRYSLSGTLGIIRMYHAASCLDLSGKVVSSGCETCGMKGSQAGDLPASVSRSPSGDLDFRVSFAVPAEIVPPVQRPVITGAPTSITRGRVFNLTYSYNGPVTGVTLAAPCANTHSINMNQRVIYLNMESATNGIALIHAPPLSQPAAAHKGYYMIFLLGDNTSTERTYSEGIWVYLDDEKW